MSGDSAFPPVVKEQCFMSGGPWDGQMIPVARGYEPLDYGRYHKATIDVIKIAGQTGEYRRDREWTACFDWYDTSQDLRPAPAPDKRTRFRDGGLAQSLFEWLISPTIYADGYEQARGEIAVLIGEAGYSVKAKR